MAGPSWDQSKFDALVKEHLNRHSSDTWPKLLNRHMFFTTLSAFKKTPVVAPNDIESELGRQVLVRRRNNTEALAPIGYAMIAKRASKHYMSSARFERAAQRDLMKALGGRGKGGNYRDAWLRTLNDERRTLYGGRKASLGFLRAGFWSIANKLGPIVGYPRVSSMGTKIRGAAKGTVLHLAKPGDYSVTIENTAHSRTELRGGFARIGGQALQEAFNEQAASLQKKLEDDMKPETERFNRANH